MSDIPVGLRELVKRMCWTRMTEAEATDLAGLISYRLATDGWLASKMTLMSAPNHWWSTGPDEMVNIDTFDKLNKRDIVMGEEVGYSIIGYQQGKGLPLFESKDEEERDRAWDEIVALVAR